MSDLFFTSKEVATKFGVKSRVIDKIFRMSKVPTIHRDKKGSKTLIEKGGFILLQEVLTVIMESISNVEKHSKKKLVLLRLHFLELLLSQYKHQDSTQFTLLADVNDLHNVIVTYDYGFDRFIVHDFLSDTEYKFGKAWDLSSKTSQSKHKNKEHPVNGFWKNQPYGPRSNPSYKRIWVSGFTRGGKENNIENN